MIIPAAGPDAASDLGVYSARYGLPTPRVRVLSFGGPAPASGPGADGRAQEGTVDLEMAHALAPGLIYLAVPDSGGTLGVGPMYDEALSWLVDRYQPTVAGYSAGIPEGPDYSGSITGSRAGLEAAARAGTTVVTPAGNYGPGKPVDADVVRTVAWPASDPLVTAVGGTHLTSTADGRAASAVMAYARTPVDHMAGGAGLSAVFPPPPWQDGVKAVAGARRGVADVSMNGSPCSPAEAYTSTSDLAGRKPGWTYIPGTSVAAPLFAAAAACAAQAAGHPLGVLGPSLYHMSGPADGVDDIAGGTGSIPAMAGYPARPGYDLPTGIGTVGSLPLFSRALAGVGASAR